MIEQDIDIRQLLPAGSLLQGGKYRVDRYLSSGNFGNTYIVTNTGMQVQFAMKEFFLRNICYRTNQGAAVSVSPAVDPEKVQVQREKFKKEAQRLYGLTSKHLVHVHDMFEENGTVYYVMDFVKGESLAHYMERQGGQPLSEEQVRYILDQLLDGLDEIHKKQIWHLDLKPDNIMIDSDGNVVIIDFGASKQVGRSGKYTGTSNILCYTPGYAPTEQVNQNLEAIGSWTDIYALGATLYNLLTAIDPSTQNGKPLQFPQQVSPAMRQLITTMMRADIAERPQHIGDVRRLLASGAAGLGSATARGTAGRGKWVAVAAAAVVVVAVVVIVLAGGKSGEQNGVKETAQDAVEQVQEAEAVAEQSDVVEDLYLKTSYGSCRYAGPVDGDRRPHGRGKAVYDDGRVYEGPFEHGVMTGDDAYYRDEEGNTFRGTYLDGYFHRGTYVFADDGTRFEGTFLDGQPATGHWYDKDGNELPAN